MLAFIRIGLNPPHSREETAMLVAITKPHQQFPVPLTVADYEFSTSDDGDERGRVTLPPTFARSGVMTQID
jgi:hypothetical protein